MSAQERWGGDAHSAEAALPLHAAQRETDPLVTVQPLSVDFLRRKP